MSAKLLEAHALDTCDAAYRVDNDIAFAERVAGRWCCFGVCCRSLARLVAAVIGFAATGHLEKAGQCEDGRRASPFAQGPPGVTSCNLSRSSARLGYPVRRVIRFNVATWRKNSLRGWAGLPSKIEPVGTSEMTPACAPIWLPRPMRR